MQQAKRILGCFALQQAQAAPLEALHSALVWHMMVKKSAEETATGAVLGTITYQTALSQRLTILFSTNLAQSGPANAQSARKASLRAPNSKCMIFRDFFWDTHMLFKTLGPRSTCWWNHSGRLTICRRGT